MSIPRSRAPPITSVAQRSSFCLHLGFQMRVFSSFFNSKGEYAMVRYLYFGIVVLVGTSLRNQPVQGGPRAETVTILDENISTAGVTLDLEEGHTDTVTFLNHSGGTVNVNNTGAPSGAPDKDDADGYDVADDDHVSYLFVCPTDATSTGDHWEFTITYPSENWLVVTVHVNCDVDGPALPLWGIVALAVLLAAGGGVVFGQRRLPQQIQRD